MAREAGNAESPRALCNACTHEGRERHDHPDSCLDGRLLMPAQVMSHIVIQSAARNLFFRFLGGTFLLQRSITAEPAEEVRGAAGAHPTSVLGSDAEIAALWAAVTQGAFLQIRIRGSVPFSASLGPELQCFRGSLVVPCRNRPVRHLVALSAEMLQTRPGADREGDRTVL